MCFATHIKTSNRVGENKFLPQQGTHDELIKKDGIYKEMYMLQADYYK